MLHGTPPLQARAAHLQHDVVLDQAVQRELRLVVHKDLHRLQAHKKETPRRAVSHPHMAPRRLSLDASKEAAAAMEQQQSSLHSTQASACRRSPCWLQRC